MQKIVNIFYILIILGILSICQAGYYCYPCENIDGGGSQQGLMNFRQKVSKKMKEINDVINESNKIMNKINNAQKEKAISTVSTNEIYKNILKDLMQQEHSSNKINNLICKNVDSKINRLNAQIVQAEILLAKLKEKK